MKVEAAGAATKEFVGLKPRIYLILIDYNSEHKKKQKVWIKIFVERISQSEYKIILLNRNCLRHFENRI